MLRSGDVGPHVYLRRCFATPTESQVTDITQLHYEADTKTFLAPYLGLYGDYYFNGDSAGATTAATVIPSTLIIDGWSARAVGGLTAKFGNGAQIALGAERGGIGGNFALWTYRARANLPFGAH